MKISIFALSVICCTFLFILPSNQGIIEKYHGDGVETVLNSTFPPSAKTGAPGESNCTGCHTGTTQSAAGIIDVTFSGAGDEYIVGDLYTITISISTGTKNGFEMTILDDTNTKAGILNAGTNSGTSNSGGRQYIRQTVSSGILSWSFTWTAPTTDVGDLTMYYAFNKSNALGTSAGDVVYLGQYNLTSAIFNTITKHEKVDENYNVFYNSVEQEINLNYSLFENSKVLLSIQDISGRLVQQIDFGKQSEGNYSEKIMLQLQPSSGVYIVSLFVDNNVFNRKISIN